MHGSIIDVLTSILAETKFLSEQTLPRCATKRQGSAHQVIFVHATSARQSFVDDTTAYFGRRRSSCESSAHGEHVKKNGLRGMLAQ